MHWDFGFVNLAFLRKHAFAHGVLQETFLTEAADDALEGAQFGRFRVGAIRNACRTALEEFGISAAFVRKSRNGNS